MKTTVCVINPITTKEFEAGTRMEAKNYVSQDTDVIVVTVEKGPASIESRYDEMCAAPGVAEMLKKMEDKVDAFVINCFGDPGVESAREITRKPVVGAGSSSMNLACLLGDKFSIVTVLKRLESMSSEIAYRCGALSKLAGVRAVETPVLELEKDKEALVVNLVKESIDAIEKDGAHVIVLGCTGMAGLAGKVVEGLKKQGYEVPVIDPFATAVKYAAVLAQLRLSHSTLTYPEPPEKQRKW